MRQEKKYADEDKAARELVDLRNEADTACYATESSLKEYAEKLEDGEEEKIRAAIEALKEAKDAPDATAESIRAAIEALNAASHDLARRMYEDSSKEQAQQGAEGAAAGGPGGAAGAGGEAAGGDEVVERTLRSRTELTLHFRTWNGGAPGAPPFFGPISKSPTPDVSHLGN